MSADTPAPIEGVERFQHMMPFMFPGAKPVEEEPTEPPFHPELENLSRFEIYEFIFDKMKVGERVIDMMKRVNASDEPIDDVAMWVSELFVRGETDIIEHDWAFTGVNAGRVGLLEELKWDLEENGTVVTGMMAPELARRHRVLCAEDARVRVDGTEEWVLIEKLNFACLVL